MKDIHEIKNMLEREFIGDYDDDLGYMQKRFKNRYEEELKLNNMSGKYIFGTITNKKFVVDKINLVDVS